MATSALRDKAKKMIDYAPIKAVEAFVKTVKPVKKTSSVKSEKKEKITADDKYNMKVLGITNIKEWRKVEKDLAEAEADIKAGRIYSEKEFKKMFNFV